MQEKCILEPHFMQSKSLPKLLGSRSLVGIFYHKSGCVRTKVSQLEKRGNQSEIAVQLPLLIARIGVDGGSFDFAS